MGNLIWFDPGDRHSVTTNQLLVFWDSMREWFAERGYHLYRLTIFDDPCIVPYATSTIPYNPHPRLNVRKKEFEAEDPFPYAYMGGDYHNKRDDDLYELGLYTGRVMFAQDTEGRHVVIKLVKGGSEEDKILHLLASRPELKKRETFTAIIPILDLLPCEGHWFAVMPRWDITWNSVPFPTPEVCVQQIIFLLKALTFLHENRIFHHDLCSRNMLINHFSNAGLLGMPINPFRKHLLQQGALVCVLSDFDFSILLDEERYGPNPRLGILGADVIGDFPPFETLHGHVDYDPFKYDVALLGIWFSDTFQHIVKDVPLIAPLIDRMVTSRLDKRFTAKEALSFAEGILPTAAGLRTLYTDRAPRPPAYCETDLWKDLPDDFVNQWADYRDDRSSLYLRFLYYLNRHVPYGTYGVYFFRLTVRAILFVPRLFFRPFAAFSRLLVRRVT
ncbi:Cyclin-dependent kinase 1 [Psilocybe cubensis]|uniref:Protein kinase domain-containing protein n=2 Tax=Psilocybe cubensis TaxID=181762 RepID=A0A8H7XUP7_PSICU|nr:Cyclin-dependent kinase 1 [Psilocybe cubensis]KAH9476100.1 Cyclin-dependent kinase 1 [Psilocybe cubensis]